MRSSLARRAAVFGSAALLPRRSGRRPGGPGPDTSGVSDQAAHLPIQLIDALQRDLQLTPGQYLERSEPHRNSPSSRRWPASSSPTRSAGPGSIRRASPSSRSRGRDGAALRDAAAQAGFTPQEVARSAQRLDADHTALTDWIATLPPEIANLVNGVSVDIAANTVVSSDRERCRTAARSAAAGSPGGGACGPRAGARLARARAHRSPDRLLQHRRPSAATRTRPAAAETACAARSASTPSTRPARREHQRRTLRSQPGVGGGNPSASVANTMVGGPDGTDRRYLREDRAARNGLLDHPAQPHVGVAAREQHGPASPMPRRCASPAPRTPSSAPPVCKAGSTTGFNCGVVTNVGRSITVGDRVIDNGFDTTSARSAATAAAGRHRHPGPRYLQRLEPCCRGHVRRHRGAAGHRRNGTDAVGHADQLHPGRQPGAGGPHLVTPNGQEKGFASSE